MHHGSEGLESLAEMDCKIVRRAGAKHGCADGLSRPTCEHCRQRIEKRDEGPNHREVEQSILIQDTPDHRDPPVIQKNICRISCLALADAMALQLTGDMGTIYQLVRDKVVLTGDELQTGIWELQK